MNILGGMKKLCLFFLFFFLFFFFGGGGVGSLRNWTILLGLSIYFRAI